MSRRTVKGALGATALMLCSHAAWAGPGDATRLEYARSSDLADCPDRTALREAVTRRLGYDPFFPAARQAIVVEITQDDDGLRGAMRLLDEGGFIRGERELHERREHCGELVASLALAVSIALDPSAAFESTEVAEPKPDATDVNEAEKAAPAAPPKEETTSAREAPPKAPASPIVRDASTARAPAPSLPFGPRAQLFTSTGGSPGVSWGVRGGLAVRYRWLALSGELAYAPPASRDVEGGRAETSLVAASLVPCVTQAGVAGCAVLSGGYLSTAGDVALPLRSSTGQLALGARVEYLPLLFGKVRALLGVEALKPLLPLTLRLQQRDVWSSSLLTLTAAAGLQMDFP